MGGLMDGLGGALGGLPIVGSLFGGGGSSPGYGQMPTPSASYPGYGPGAYPGWPVPPATVAPPKQNFQGNLGQPGAAENFFSQNQGKFTEPGAGNAYWDQNKGGFGAPGPADQYWNGVAGSGQTNPPKGTNYAQDAYLSFAGSSPANMDPYFANAQRRADEGINKQYAARGMGRSSAALDQLSEANQNIAAQEAQANAQYGLQRGGLMGSLAQGADTSSRANAQNKLSWLTGLGGLALGTQNADLARLTGGAQVANGLDQNALAKLAAGMTGALGAQNALENRGQNFFGNNLAYAKATAGPMQDIYTQMLMGDQALMGNQMGMALAVPREALNQDVMNQQMAQQNQASSSIFGGGGGGGGGLMGGLLAAFL